MKFCAITQSERGKDVQKTGSTFIRTDFYGENRQRIFGVIIEQKGDSALIHAYEVDAEGPHTVYKTEIGNEK